jgi:hypothetical protein
MVICQSSLAEMLDRLILWGGALGPPSTIFETCNSSILVLAFRLAEYALMMPAAPVREKQDTVAPQGTGDDNNQ